MCKRNQESWPNIPLPGTSRVLKIKVRMGSENMLDWEDSKKEKEVKKENCA